MKRFLIILAIILVIAGTIILTLGLVNRKKVEVKTNTYEINEEVENFDIDFSITDLEFQKSDNSKFELVLDEQEKFKYEFKVENKTLKLKSVDTYKWYEKIFVFNFNSLKAKIKTPTTIFNNLKINSSTGNVSISKDFEFNNLKAELSTGNVKVESKINKDIEIEVSTGNIELNNINSNNIKLSTSTGNVRLNNVTSNELLKVNTSTGNILFDSIDANEIRLEASTGNVKGSVLKAMTFDVDSSTGKRNYPKGTTGNLCYIRTSTGDINVEIKNS